MSDISSYPQPLHVLFTLPTPVKRRSEIDYSALGLGPEHIPDLIRLATDRQILGFYDDFNYDAANEQAYYAPVHAWLVLGELRAESAIEPLLGLFSEFEQYDDYLVPETMPYVFGQIGPACMGPVDAYLADTSQGKWARGAAFDCLLKIGLAHPDARDACVAILTRQLELEPAAEDMEDMREMNAFMIGPLTELKAVESAPVIRQAFVDDRVAEGICGDWPYVRDKLGVASQPGDEELDLGATPLFESLFGPLRAQLAGLDAAGPEARSMGGGFAPSSSLPGGKKKKADRDKEKAKRQLAKQRRRIERRKKKR